MSKTCNVCNDKIEVHAFDGHQGSQHGIGPLAPKTTTATTEA